MPSFPVAGADERQAVLTKSETVEDRSHTVLVQGAGFVRPAWKLVIRVLISSYRAALDKADGSSNTPVSPVTRT